MRSPKKVTRKKATYQGEPAYANIIQSLRFLPLLLYTLQQGMFTVNYLAYVYKQQGMFTVKYLAYVYKQQNVYCQLPGLRLQTTR